MKKDLIKQVKVIELDKVGLIKLIGPELDLIGLHKNFNDFFKIYT